MAKKKPSRKKPPAKPKTTETIHVDTSSSQENAGNGDVDFALSLVNDGLTVPKITEITDLLADSKSMLVIAERVSIGASVKTVEMTLGLPTGLLAGWLKNGSDDIENDESPYRLLFMFYRAAQAEAQTFAEASLLKKNPAAWLESMDVGAQLAEYRAKINTVPGTAQVSESDQQSKQPEAGEYRDF